jgi:hypothetical protein
MFHLTVQEHTGRTYCGAPDETDDGLGRSNAVRVRDGGGRPGACPECLTLWDDSVDAALDALDARWATEEGE